MIRVALTLALSLLLQSPSKATTPQLESSIEESSTSFKVSVKNVSDASVTIPEIYLSSAKRSGHWLFLYDETDKSLQQGWSTTMRIPEAELPAKTLHPGQSMEKEFSKAELLSYFMYLPDCFYLTTLYRKTTDKGVVYSKAAQPIRHCTD